MIPEHIRVLFDGKDITVMGLGLLGRGVGDALFLAECGAHLTITDLKSKEQLETSIEKLQQYPNITYTLGEHKLEDFEGKDMILKSAGVPLDSKYIEHARTHNIPVEMSAALFAKHSNVPLIGITGTRGKSTVTHMIAHTLREMTEGGTVILGGNIRGVSNLQLFKEIDPDNTIAVFELDSWQLQGFGELTISPHISIFTTLMDDHLNYYKGDRDAYLKDKLNIYTHQTDRDTFITTPLVLNEIESYIARTGSKKIQGGELILADASMIPEEMLLRVPGEHNRTNAALALQALMAVGMSEDEALEGLSTFHGVEGRLEYMGITENGVALYNDNNATTPDATLAALRALSDSSRKLILIMGGADKDIDLTVLAREIPNHTKLTVLLPGTGTTRLVEKYAKEDLAPLANTESFKTITVSNLEEAVYAAVDAAEPGDIILFSPAFASFGLFTNEYDRNDQFVSYARKYLAE